MTTTLQEPLVAPYVQAGASESHHDSTLAAVSRAIVHIHKQFLGKGPVRVRSYLSGDVLTVILEGGFLRSEQTLSERGHVREVIDSRLAMHEAMQDDYRAAIESTLYRSVRSFLSASDPEHDLQAEVFVLERDPDVGTVDERRKRSLASVIA